MILRMPEYCRNFLCIADKCSDNCCIGWEIDIDNKTADFYSNIDGKFGKRLKENIIDDNGTKSFILDSNERCPFLNGNNLCDIILNLGEDKLCQICTDHPRYYEWFDGIKEGGIGLCCEEAARIILSESSPAEYYDIKITCENCDDYDYELYDCLFTAREKIIFHICNSNIPFKNRICDILSYSEELQCSIDNGNFKVSDIVSNNSFAEPDLKAILQILLTLEPINESWKPYVQSCISLYDKVFGHIKLDSEEIKYLRNIAVYFIWRYFLKGVFDEEFLSKIKLAAVSIAVLGYMFCCCKHEKGILTLSDCIEITKNYSKEIEYCEENLNKLADISYEHYAFSTERIKGIFLHSS